MKTCKHRSWELLKDSHKGKPSKWRCQFCKKEVSYSELEKIIYNNDKNTKK